MIDSGIIHWPSSVSLVVTGITNRTVQEVGFMMMRPVPIITRPSKPVAAYSMNVLSSFDIKFESWHD